MENLSINTPALLFPAITLLMLAYTNRFLALSNLVRNLHAQYEKHTRKDIVLRQIRSLRSRINLIRYMQGFGVLSFLLCVLCMYFIFRHIHYGAGFVFAASLICLIVSLVISLIEIFRSTSALELELSDIEELEEPSFLDRIKGKES
jgi:ABC-type glycerol-3-phosphate transport system permease component